MQPTDQVNSQIPIQNKEKKKKKQTLKDFIDQPLIISEQNEFAKLFTNLKIIPKYKTRFCKHFASGNCKLLDKCIFAHGEQELNLIELIQKNPNLYENYYRHFNETQKQFAESIGDLFQQMYWKIKEFEYTFQFQQEEYSKLFYKTFQYVNQLTSTFSNCMNDLKIYDSVEDFLLNNNLVFNQKNNKQKKNKKKERKFSYSQMIRDLQQLQKNSSDKTHVQNDSKNIYLDLSSNDTNLESYKSKVNQQDIHRQNFLNTNHQSKQEYLRCQSTTDDPQQIIAYQYEDDIQNQVMRICDSEEEHS